LVVLQPTKLVLSVTLTAIVILVTFVTTIIVRKEMVKPAHLEVNVVQESVKTAIVVIPVVPEPAKLVTYPAVKVPVPTFLAVKIQTENAVLPAAALALVTAQVHAEFIMITNSITVDPANTAPILTPAVKMYPAAVILTVTVVVAKHVMDLVRALMIIPNALPLIVIPELALVEPAPFIPVARKALVATVCTATMGIQPVTRLLLVLIPTANALPLIVILATAMDLVHVIFIPAAKRVPAALVTTVMTVIPAVT